MQEGTARETSQQPQASSSLRSPLPLGVRFGCLALVLTLATLALAGCGSGGSGGGGAGNGGKPHPDGGEKSIEDFGSEAGGSERSALLDVFHGYLGAIAARDNPAACSHLAAAVRRSLEQFAAGKQGHESCVTILPRLLAPTAATIARQQAEGRVTKVRVEGDRSFIVFHAPGAKLYQLTLVREDGRWKAATVTPSILVPSLATLGR